MNCKKIVARLLISLSVTAFTSILNASDNTNYRWAVTKVPFNSSVITTPFTLVGMNGIAKTDSVVYLAIHFMNGVVNNDNLRTCIYKTSDSMKSIAIHSEQPVKNENGRNRLAFTSNHEGILQNHLKRYISTDTLKTWTEYADTLNPRRVAVDYYHYSHFVLRCYDHLGGFAVSEDEGATWALKPYPDSAGYTENQTNEVRFIDSTHLFCWRQNPYGVNGRELRFYLSNNSGDTWKGIGCTIAGYTGDSTNLVTIDKIEFFDGHTGIGVGSRLDSLGNATAFCMKTSDLGLHWVITDDVPFSLDTLGIIRHLGRIRGDTLAIVFNTGPTKISTDLGSSWKWLVKDVVRYVYDKQYQPILNMGNVCFFDSHTAFACFDLRADAYINVLTLVPDNSTSVDQAETTSLNSLDLSTIWIEGIHPSPVRAQANIAVNFTRDTDILNTRVEVYNSVGTLVKSHRLQDLHSTDHKWGGLWTTLELPMDNLPSGVYVVNISDGRLQGKAKRSATLARMSSLDSVQRVYR